MRTLIVTIAVIAFSITAEARPNVGFVCLLKGHNCKYSPDYVSTNTVPIIHQAAFKWCRCKEWQEKWNQSLAYADTYCMYCGNRFDKIGKIGKIGKTLPDAVNKTYIKVNPPVTNQCMRI